MRITHSSMYSNFVGSMNSNLSDYMESTMQGSSMKRINRPSDDPVGMARVLSYRASIERNVQYESNSKDAHAWLSSTDGALQQAEVILTRIQEKASQISSGTVTAENRKQVSAELRQMLGQLINLANTEYNGQHLFAGTKTNMSPYELGLGISTTDTAAAEGAWKVAGDTSSNAIVRFPHNAGIPPIAPATADYEFSKDGGKTWTSKTLVDPGPGVDTVLDLDGVTITLPRKANGITQAVNVTAYDPALDTRDADGNITNISRKNGTVFVVRPTAFYKGDDNDVPPAVDVYGNSPITNTAAQGKFDTDVRIRMDSNASVGQNGKVNYSYSTDNGITWKSATTDTSAGSNRLRLHVPGGYLDVEAPAGNTISEGQQFVIRPRRSDLGMEIASGEFIGVTNDGKDFFGGQYAGPGKDVAVADPAGGKNLFETVSNLIAWAENGMQEGCQEALTNIKDARAGLLTNMAQVGGKVNRVSLNVTMLESHRDDQTTRISALEDVDLTKLFTKLSQQQMAYQTVLQTSSMIMKLNLTNFI